MKHNKEEWDAKQKAFCEEYVIDFNGKQAAIRAGYAVSSATGTASRLLTYDNVQKYLTKLKAKRSERLEICADKVLIEYARIGFADVRDYMTWEDDRLVLKPSDELTDNQAAAVSEVKMKPGQHGTEISMKFHNKLSALEAMSKHLGLFEKDNHQRAEHPLVTDYMKERERMKGMSKEQLQELANSDIDTEEYNV